MYSSIAELLFILYDLIGYVSCK